MLRSTLFSCLLFAPLFWGTILGCAQKGQPSDSSVSSLVVRPIRTYHQTFMTSEFGSKKVEILLDATRQTVLTLVADSSPAALEIVEGVPLPQEETGAIELLILGATQEAGSVTVSLNGSLLLPGEFEFDSVSGAVKIPSAKLALLNKIEIAYKMSPAPIDQPGFIFYKNLSSDIKIHDRASAAEIVPVRLDESGFVLSKEESIAGRVLVISHLSVSSSSKTSLEIAERVWDKSDFEIKGALSGQQCASDQLSFTDQILDFSSCGFAPGEKVSLNYQFISAQRKQFLLEDEELSRIKKAVFNVQVNGVETEDYLLDEEFKTITFESLNAKDQVTVDAWYYGEI